MLNKTKAQIENDFWFSNIKLKQLNKKHGFKKALLELHSKRLNKDLELVEEDGMEDEGKATT
jgi:hypothetical protein